jgi:hypothetical protein
MLVVSFDSRAIERRFENQFKQLLQGIRLHQWLSVFVLVTILNQYENPLLTKKR